MPSLLEDMKTYIGFDDEDARALQGFREPAAPHFERIADHFYACILQHPRAHAAITGGEAQVQRLKHTLVEWMDSGLSGPHDEAYYERRARIGRVHVRIGLPQQYMFTAMNVVRLDFRRVVETVHADDTQAARKVNDALDRLFDLELGIMLHTYQEDSEERLRRQERLATIGQLAASIGHDLRNPLGVIQSSLYILNKRTPDERQGRHLTKIASQVEQCNSIVTDLLEMARNRPPKRVRIDLRELFEQSLSALGARLHKGIELHEELDPDVELVGDPGLLRQVLVNLVTNAVGALEGRDGHVWLRAKSEEGGTRLLVEDDGPGFDPATLPTVFEPLVTTRPKGTGLGLALVRSVAERHGGSAEAANRPEGGAVVSMWLPHSSS